MKVPLSFCIVEVNLTNVVSGQKYSFNATTREVGPTNNLRVSVVEHVVPFDSHYTAVVSLSNGSHNVKQMAENDITLSKLIILYQETIFHLFSTL